jgi:hypothetical protein
LRRAATEEPERAYTDTYTDVERPISAPVITGSRVRNRRRVGVDPGSRTPVMDVRGTRRLLRVLQVPNAALAGIR